MPRARPLAGLLAALLLGGCLWEGPAFYTVDPARPGPLPSGLYQAETPDDESAPDRLRIGRAADGALLVAPPEDYETGHPMRVVLAPLPMTGRQLWVVQTRIGEPDDPVAYGLLDSAAGALVLDPALHCEGSEALVRQAGGAVEGEGGSPSCIFRDRAALERALIAYAGAHPGLDKPTRLTRIAD
jgi:hypothetical protein